MNNNSNIDKNSPLNQYLLIFRGKDWDEGLAPGEIQQVLDRFMDWSQGLVNSGKLEGGQALARTGSIITRGSVSDGPFAESKESIGGYCILQASSYEEALAIAKSSPFLDFGGAIELRPLAAECPCIKRIRETHGIVPSSNSFLGTPVEAAAEA